MKISVVDMHSKPAGEISVPDEGKQVHPDTLAQVMKHVMSNARSPIAHTKDRGEVSGGGIKPWKQKGTGRARAGSSRSPIWRGGGITFGPRSNQNFATRIPRKMYQHVLQGLVYAGLRDKTIVVVKEISLQDSKTKSAIVLLEQLGITSNTLILLDSVDPKLDLAFRNIPGIFVTDIANMNILDLPRYSMVLLTKAALAQLFVTGAEKEETKPPVASETKKPRRAKWENKV